jgi:hypothetical protein
MTEISPLKHDFVDLAAVLFVIGGVVSLVMSILTIPIASVYPMVTAFNFSMVFLVVLGISLICSLEAIHCYSLATKRILSEAGIKGIVFGALLLIFSMGLVGSYRQPDTTTLLTALSSILILIAGGICFVMRHMIISASPIVRQQAISQRAHQS